MTPPDCVFALPGNEALALALAIALGAQAGTLETRSFPDGESHLRYVDDVSGKSIALVCTLDRPDDKILRLLFAARAARELGAQRIGLVCPYLAYMRQDRRFHGGEAVTSAAFAALLSGYFDWLVTVDPHLHRYKSLAELYAVPALAVQAAGALAAWIGREVLRPLLVGPDSESEQWVGSVARAIGAPHVVLAKVRRGDRDVEVSIPDIAPYVDRTPVLVDDIVSTARTMIAATRRLCHSQSTAPVCVAVHGVFADHAHDELRAAGAARIVTTNTIPHASNAIDVTGLLAEGIGAVA